jgi:DNA-binding CsgD family transcriptional regulator
MERTIFDIFMQNEIDADKYLIPNKDTNSKVYLTCREAKVLHKLIGGYRPKQIAYAFGSSLHTINTHLSNIKTKLACPSIFDLGVKIGGWIPNYH